jgi:hypothetical protein
MGMFTINALIDYKGRYMQNRSATFADMIGYWDPNSSIGDQGLARIISTGISDRQNVSELRFESASITMNAPSHLVRTFRARSLQLSLQGSNLGLWTQYRGRDPGINSSPIGEKTTDNGKGIARPRAYSLQVRLGY